MRATNWEFENRALVFGMIFSAGFLCSFIDPHNGTVALANSLAGLSGFDGDMIARILFFIAAILAAAAAFVRTWASSHLHAEIVYASDVKAASLVADGPYRYVRNPLYFGNVLLAVGIGAMAGRVGFFVLVAGMVLFCYRLIIREEAELAAVQGEGYRKYRAFVPRLWPSWRARLPSAGHTPECSNGFKAEFWVWGFALALATFAITLAVRFFFAILAASIGGLWLVTTIVRKTS